MSHRRAVVGLSDSRFDSDLHNDEIDHDFFDNPCISSETRGMKKSPAILAENRGQIEDDSKILAPETSYVSNVPIVNGIQTPEPANNRDPTPDVIHSVNQPDKLFLTKPTVFTEDELQTPDTCVSSPNLDYSLSHNNQMFSTGKLLECLTQPNDLQSWVDFKLNDPQQTSRRANLPIDFQSFASSGSGPKSSYFNLAFEKYQGTGESYDDSFLPQDASTAQQQQADSMRMKLFDVSSSSSEGSNSDSDPGSLDTEDEEFVDLLEKYYDYIDLGESDYSDITEVSPMSSLTASPLPPFNGINNVEENILLASERGESNSSGLALSLAATGRISSNSNHGQLFKPKPLPPLIIHTMEEVSGINEHSNTMYWPGHFEGLHLTGNSSQAPGHKKASLSLLMKADPDDIKIIPEGQSNPSDFQPSGSSSISIPSRVSFRSTVSSASSRSASCISNSSLTVNKRQVKNHTFTPDQMRRIEKDNTVLLRKILDTNKGHHGHRWSHGKGTTHHHKASHHPSLKASAAIARQRQQRRIEHENSILIRRLQNAKPSKEIVEAFATTNNNVKCT